MVSSRNDLLHGIRVSDTNRRRLMLRKIIVIKNVGRFVSYSATGDVELKRYNLVFAENGRGKTTLCAILRSLQSGDSSYILGRTTLGGTAPAEIKVLLSDGNTSIFDNAAWTVTVPDIAIFDSTFVSENVHSGDVVDIDHRRNLYSVIVGKLGVILAEAIDHLDGASREKSSEIREKSGAIQAFAGGIPPDSFVAIESDPQIDEKIDAKQQELEAVRQAAQIRSRNALERLSVPAFPRAAFEALLEKTFEGIAADAERRIDDQIHAHNMSTRGQSWLSEGVGYIHDGMGCPFCGQPLEGATALIDAYRSFFSDGYNALRSEINVLRRQIEMIFGDREIAELGAIVVQNTAAIEFWARFCHIAPPVYEGSGPLEILRGLRVVVLALLDRKAATPLERIGIDAPYTGACMRLLTAQQAVTTYNAGIDAANSVIESKRVATRTADLERVGRELSSLRAAKKRHEPEASRACADYAAALAAKKSIEEQKASVRKELDGYTKEVIGRYEQTINHLLEDFHAGFRIAGTSHGYPGGVASSSYQILINNVSVELGDSSTPFDMPSFKNTLSAGDKSTLALAFFLAQLQHDPDRAAKIVVFDDPFNSQDSFRKDCTVQKIKKCGQDSSQVIVLSHDIGFLKRVWDRLQAFTADRKCLEMTRIGQANTTILEWDIEGATQDRYKADRKVLTDFYHVGDGEARDVVQKIRPVLETYCRILGAGAIAEADMLGSIIGKIRTVGSGHQLYPLCDDLEELNEYTKRYHHGENTQAAVEPITDGELQGYVRRTLEMTGGC
jgi:wobble nucleotide-excising tRNase